MADKIPVIPASIEDFTPDDKNANQGTERGNNMLADSLEAFGAGRSILVDKNKRIIAGNKTFQKFTETGLENVVIVPTDGKTLVAVQRTDIDLDSPEGRSLALADNRISQINLEWNVDVLEEIAQDVDVSNWFNEDEQENWAWEKPATTRFNGTDEDEDIPSIMDGGVPLAIVLNPSELKEWNIVKSSTKASSDKALLLMLLRGEV